MRASRSYAWTWRPWVSGEGDPYLGAFPQVRAERVIGQLERRGQ